MKVDVKESRIIKWGSGEKFEHLRRKRLMLEDGLSITENPRYMEAAAAELNLKSKKYPDTPLRVNDRGAMKSDEKEKLKQPDIAIYRKNTMRVLYQAAGSGHFAFAANYLQKGFATPTQKCMTRLKRVVMYGLGASKLGIYLKIDEEADDCDTFTDTAWAGNIDNRKSVTCLMIFFGV